MRGRVGKLLQGPVAVIQSNMQSGFFIHFGVFKCSSVGLEGSKLIYQWVADCKLIYYPPLLIIIKKKHKRDACYGFKINAVLLYFSLFVTYISVLNASWTKQIKLHPQPLNIFDKVRNKCETFAYN